MPTLCGNQKRNP